MPPGGRAEATDHGRTALVLLGQLQTLLFQIELLKRCDPEILSERAMRVKLKHNALMVLYLHSSLEESLTAQMEYRLSVTTYALWLVLRRAAAESAALVNEVDLYARYRDRDRFFAATMHIHDGWVCPFHREVSLELYGNGASVVKQLCLLNDTENLIKQLNYMHCAMSADAAIAALAEIDVFFVETLGAGLVAPPEVYDSAQPCAVCFEELSVTANQGDTIYRRLGSKTCDHVVRQIVTHASVEDLGRHLPYLRGVDPDRLDAATRILADHASRRAADQGESDAEIDRQRVEAANILDSYNVFTETPAPVYKLSELRFWLASGTSRTGRARGSGKSVLERLDSDLSTLLSRERALEKSVLAVERALFGREMVHFHRARAALGPTGGGGDGTGPGDLIGRLLSGSPLVTPEAEIESLIRSCYAHHLSLPIFKRLGDPERADAETLANLLENFRADGAGRGNDDRDPTRRLEHGGGVDDPGDARGWLSAVPPGGRGYGDGEPEDAGQRTRQLLDAAARDLATRRKNYAERLSTRSFANLDRCVRAQRAELEKLMRINVFGEVLPAMFIDIKNGFLARREFMRLVESRAASTLVRLDAHDESAYEWHEYVRSTVMRHAIDPAIVPGLTIKFYECVNGPLFSHHRHNFAQPSNTPLYFAVENVGLLPHVKEELANFMCDTSVSSWMISEFRRFYDFDGLEGVTEIHRTACRYIREAVFATAVFDTVFHCGDVRLLRADSIDFDANGPRVRDGLYLTFETDKPLVAIWGTTEEGRLDSNSVVVIERDLYSALYAILQKHAPATHDSRGTSGPTHDEASATANDE